MKEIMEATVLPELRERAAGVVGRRRVLRIAGMGESAVEELVAPVYAKWKDDPVTILASPGEVQLHLAVRGRPVEAEAAPRGARGGFPGGARQPDLRRGRRGPRARGRTPAPRERPDGRLRRVLHRRNDRLARHRRAGLERLLPRRRRHLRGRRQGEPPRRGPGDAPALRRRVRGDRAGDGSRRARAGSERTSGSRSPGSRGRTAGPRRSPSAPCTSRWRTASGAEVARKRLFVGDRAVVRRAASIQALELLRRHLSGEEA